MAYNRTRPYTDAGLCRVSCVRCPDRRASHQWSVQLCANGRRRIWVALCDDCDVLLNRTTLDFIRHPDADALIAAYVGEG